jgi:hypothetical protein
MIGTIVTTRIVCGAARGFRAATAALLRWKAAGSARAEQARTGDALEIVKEVLVVSPRELAALEEAPGFVCAVERARALHAAGQLGSCGTCGSYLLPDEGGCAHAA